MVDSAGLGETPKLLFRIHSSGIEAVTDLLVRGFVTWFTCVAAASVVRLWSSEEVIHLVVLLVFTVFDNCSLIQVMAGVLMVEVMVVSLPG